MTQTNELSLAPSKWDDKFDRIVKYARDRRDDSDPEKPKLPADLKLQLRHWTTVYGLLSTGHYARTAEQLNAILVAIPGISVRTARNYLEDTKRFFAILDEPNQAFERVMIIEELRDDMRLAKIKGDFRSLAALRKIYIAVNGFDKPQEVVENKTVINILNYNPEQLGGQMISDEALEKMINNFLEDDKKKEKELFEPYEDVSSAQDPGGSV